MLRLAADAEAAIDACAIAADLLVIVDLATPGFDVGVARRAIEGVARIRVPAIVAFGPHVHEASLEAARAAGCDEVLSRGQFLSQADAIIARHATAS